MWDGMEASRRIICDATGHHATLRPPGLIACATLPWLALYFAGWLCIDAAVDGGADTIVVRRSRQDFNLVVDRFDSWYGLENVACAALRVGREAKPLRTTVLPWKPKVIQSKHAVVGEAGEPFLHLFGDAGACPLATMSTRGSGQ